MSTWLVSCAPGTASSDPSRLGSPEAGPRYWPLAAIDGLAPEFRWRIDVTRSVARETHACQAAIAPSAADQGQETLKYAALRGSGWIVNVNSVTIPKLP